METEAEILDRASARWKEARVSEILLIMAEYGISIEEIRDSEIIAEGVSNNPRSDNATGYRPTSS